MLHITNGESVVGGFRDGGIPGLHLSWLDVLHDGPVPPTSSLEELSDIRANALAGFGWGTCDGIRAEFEARDRTLQDFRDHEEVVLWFEHDLFDQLQLIQLLDWFAARDLTGTRLSIIQIDRHPEVAKFHGLGELNPGQLAALLPARAPVTARQLTGGRKAWRAFRAPDPATLAALAEHGVPELPFLGPALTRFLEEYPSVRNGLSRTQQQLLQAAASGSRRRQDFYLATRTLEPCPWGDGSVYLRLDWLAAGPHPALDCVSDGEFAITGHGLRLLGDEADWIRSQHVLDMWLGGVHLIGGEAAWRWDTERRSIVRAV